jgi:hypothetical protein
VPEDPRLETPLGPLTLPVHLIVPAAVDPVVYSASNRIQY